MVYCRRSVLDITEYMRLIQIDKLEACEVTLGLEQHAALPSTGIDQAGQRFVHEQLRVDFYSQQLEAAAVRLGARQDMETLEASKAT